MKKTYLAAGIVVAIVVIGAVLVLTRKNPPVDNTKTASDVTPPVAVPPTVVPDTAEPPLPTIPTPPPPPKAPATKPDAHFSGEGDITGESDVMVYEVSFDGKKFSPSTVTVKAGDIVQFKNKSTENFRPASDPHPAHTNYPGFDAQQQLAPGKTFEFKFLKLGSWGYHDHLHPSITGTVVVK